MPLFTLARKPEQKSFQKLGRCARTKNGALSALVEEHGPVVKKLQYERKGVTHDGSKPKPGTVYQFEDGTQAVLQAYVGMC